ncbi:unnamed protein product [Prunus armeniaca]|uniref:Uncharacterized protein n=1 Tax=Prunus armeniaca TaxID=36596 RepID=A0A6J5V496_PRUAR|nr:unnamed protein product [Prunus armeniaca]
MKTWAPASNSSKSHSCNPAPSGSVFASLQSFILCALKSWVLAGLAPKNPAGKFYYPWLPRVSSRIQTRLPSSPAATPTFSRIQDLGFGCSFSNP